MNQPLSRQDIDLMNKGLDAVHVVYRLLVQQLASLKQPRYRLRERKKHLHGVISAAIGEGPKVSPDAHGVLIASRCRFSPGVLAVASNG